MENRERKKNKVDKDSRQIIEATHWDFVGVSALKTLVHVSVARYFSIYMLSFMCVLCSCWSNRYFMAAAAVAAAVPQDTE